MATSRRSFLSQLAVGTAASALARPALADTPASVGSPPAFGATPAIGPAVSGATFAEAQKLVQIAMSDKELAQAASNWREQMAYLTERRTGPNKHAVAETTAPASVWTPLAPPARAPGFSRSAVTPPPLPTHAEDIAFAPLTVLSRWIETRAITSLRLTEIYLERLQRFQSQLLCTITLTRAHALAQAKQADAEIATGHYRGPLHGIPFGVKDLLDTAGIATTYGAEPFRDRVPAQDAVVVKRLYAAGAVLVAKLSLGALALNDIWFGGQTRNPWWSEEGSSGSSAGPGAATAAGLVGFAIGSETGGSIVSPSMRCGVAGLRPTFGRVPRTGAMTLCWSLDKLGVMARGVEDTVLVLAAISGADAGDVSSRASTLTFHGDASVKGSRVGYFPSWMKEAPSIDVDRHALEALRALGLTVVESHLPPWPYGSLDAILFAEAAASFETLTASHGVDRLRVQSEDAWPNIFRQSRFISAVDLVQAERLRREVAQEMTRVFSEVDVLLVPSFRNEMLTLSNHTGHPSLTLRAGFVHTDRIRSDWAADAAKIAIVHPPHRVPHGVTFIGGLFDEGTLTRVGIALEQHLGVASERPSGFA